MVITSWQAKDEEIVRPRIEIFDPFKNITSSPISH